MQKVLKLFQNQFPIKRKHIFDDPEVGDRREDRHRSLLDREEDRSPWINTASFAIVPKKLDRLINQ